MASQIASDGQNPSYEETVGPRRRPVVRWAVLAGVAVLLGHAAIEHAVSPFGLAYFAALTEILGTKRSWIGLFAVAGAYWQGGIGAASVLAIGCVLYMLFRRMVFRKRRPDIHWAPLMAGFIDTAARLAAVGSVWTRYDVLTAVAEGALVVILTVIFISTVPLATGRNASRELHTDQWISLTIAVGSVIAGMSGVSWHGIVVSMIAIDWSVLVVASVGGPLTAAAVGVVLGVLSLVSGTQSLAGVAVLAFAGMLAGMVRDAGRLVTVFVFAATAAMLGATKGASLAAVEHAVLEALIAGALCLFTPRRLTAWLAEYVPGTPEQRYAEQQRLRRVRAVLYQKIQNMGQVFDELSQTFAEVGESQVTSDQQLLTDLVGAAANSVCATCARRAKCWDREGVATYNAIVRTLAKLEQSPGLQTPPTPDLRERCVRLDPMMNTLRSNLELTARDARWMTKLREQRSLVAAQLSGVANVIRSIASEVEHDNEASLYGEDQVYAALEKMGLYVDHVNIVSLEPGKIEVEVTQPSQGSYENSVRVIGPLLSGIVGENITVVGPQSEEPGPCTSVFTSARVYRVETAVATAARDGRLVSGDTHVAVDLDNGRFAVAVSDGMGNGDRARRESKAALDLLQKLLRAGFDEQLAVKTVNSTLLLRSREEMFTTLDLALVDLFSARTEFLKVGSAPGFLWRNGEVEAISAANVPIGILQDIDVQTITAQLCEGDTLVLMSDGVFDAPNVYDKEEWFCERIASFDVNDPQRLADGLIEAAIGINHGQVGDDMTVVVAQVRREQPEWAAIKLPGITGLRKQEKRQRGA